MLEILNGDNKLKVINKLKDFITEFSKLTVGWNGYNASPIDSNVIARSYEFINMIDKEDLVYINDPEVFPTANKTIQFEYEPNNSVYLEIEIFPEEYLIFYRSNWKSLTMCAKTLDDVKDIIRSKLNI